VLVAEEQHEVPVERSAQLGDRRVVERLAQVDAAHFRTDGHRHRPHVELDPSSPITRNGQPNGWPHWLWWLTSGTGLRQVGRAVRRRNRRTPHSMKMCGGMPRMALISSRRRKKNVVKSEDTPSA
jgi:hypothetical protein